MDEIRKHHRIRFSYRIGITFAAVIPTRVMLTSRKIYRDKENNYSSLIALVVSGRYCFFAGRSTHIVMPLNSLFLVAHNSSTDFLTQDIFRVHSNWEELIRHYGFQIGLHL